MVKKTALFWLAIVFCLVLCGCCSHNFVQVEYRKSTCWEEGIDSKRCTKCNELLVIYSEPLAHVYKRTEPEVGIELFTCVLCGDSYTQESETAPTEPEATKAAEATEGKAAGEWSVVDAAHTYKLHQTQEATCAAEGFKTWYCDHCGDVKYQTLTALPHSYKESQGVAPDCIREGKRVFACTVCGHSYEEPSPCLGHDDGPAEIIKAATCTTTGTQVVTCTRCGNRRSEEIKMLGHQKTAATCLEAARCERCQVELAPPLGHTAQSGSCGRCGEKLGDSRLEQELTAENRRYALAVASVNAEADQKILANKEAEEQLRQRYGIEQLLQKAACEAAQTALIPQIASVEQQLYSTGDPMERQRLQLQLDAMNSELKTVLACLRIWSLQEENATLEAQRSQRLAEEAHRHEENIKEIKNRYS
ncbi:MAG: hypothetical protein IKU07_03160 [Oscillospiraceae bacterium]|nr:hypothetical protein [Oscillospiraceae bacterium]